MLTHWSYVFLALTHRYLLVYWPRAQPPIILTLTYPFPASSGQSGQTLQAQTLSGDHHVGTYGDGGEQRTGERACQQTPGSTGETRWGRVLISIKCHWINTLRLRQNGYYFADTTFKCIFAKVSVRILIEISLKFLPKGPIKNISALVQIMAWLRPGDKPLSEPMMVLSPMHKCITQPQWVKKNWNLIDSLVHGRCGCNLKIFKLTPRIDIVSTSCKIDFRSMMQYLTDEESKKKKNSK